MISMKIDASGALEALAGLEKQVLFAAAQAVNDTAQDIIAAQQHEMRDVFRNPTPWTLNSLRQYGQATKANPQTTIGFKANFSKGIDPEKYLKWEILSGQRRMKRFELALRAVGALPPGYYAAPGAAAKMDSYGNMSQGQIIQILSDFRAFPETGYKANITDTRKAALKRGTKKQPGFEYFVGQPGHKSWLGIWQRFRLAHGSAVKPIMIFIPHAIYKGDTYPFFDVCRFTAQKTMGPNFNNRLRAALASAR